MLVPTLWDALESSTVRKGLSRAAVALVVTTSWFAIDLAATGSAAPRPKGFASVTQVVRTVSSESTLTLSPSDLRLRIDVTTKELRVATQELDQLERQLTSASVATDELREETSAVAEETLRAAIDGYRNSEQPQTILEASDLTASMRAAALGGAAVSSDVESFDAYRDLRRDLEIEESALVERSEQVIDADATVEVLEEQLAQELLRFGEVEEQRLQDQAALAAVRASNRAQARGRKQGFFLDTCPVNASHNFIDSWGFARSGGRRHQGIDMMASLGSEIVAPVSGRVEHYSNRVGGRSFRLFGDDGNYFYGTHMSGFGTEGQVRAGEVIGYVGNDGNAAGTPPHLHFEIHPGGRGNPINPYIDASAVCSGAE